jgi:hypothetical protein
MKQAIALCLLLLVFGQGCLEETRTFSMSVRNELAQPVSVCVTKTYGPPEPMWMSPEDLAGPSHPPSDQTPPGIVIPPGKTLNAPPFTGRFVKDRGFAVLRVYAGKPTLTEMNAISQGSPNRLDVPLDIGLNRIEIKEGEDGSMTAVRVTGAWPATQRSSGRP